MNKNSKCLFYVNLRFLEIYKIKENTFIKHNKWGKKFRHFTNEYFQIVKKYIKCK